MISSKRGATVRPRASRSRDPRLRAGGAHRRRGQEQPSASCARPEAARRTGSHSNAMRAGGMLTRGAWQTRVGVEEAVPVGRNLHAALRRTGRQPRAPRHRAGRPSVVAHGHERRDPSAGTVLLHVGDGEDQRPGRRWADQDHVVGRRRTSLDPAAGTVGTGRRSRHSCWRSAATAQRNPAARRLAVTAS